MARDVEAGKAFVRLALTGQAQVKQGLAQLGSSMRSFAGFAAKITASIGAIGLGAGFIASIKAASDMQETMSKFNVVFGESADVVKKWGDELASSIGRSKKEVTSFLASSQDLLVPLGFDATAAEDLSKQIVKLTFDLGSFNNMADEDVFRDLQAALTGSGEVMKKYGVVVNEARVKQELLNQSIDPKVATEAQKAFARLQIILQGTAAAQGDAIRTSDGFANSWKRLTAVIDDAKVSLGEKFLPAATTLVQTLSDAVKVLSDMAQGTNEMGGEFRLSATTIIESLSVIVDSLNFARAALKDLHAELKALELLKGFLKGGISIEEFKRIRAEVSAIKKEAEDIRKSDFAADFKKRMEAIQEDRAKAKETGTGAVSGGEAAGNFKTAVQEAAKKTPLSADSKKALDGLTRQGKASAEQQKKAGERQAELTQDVIRTQEKALRVLEDIKRQGEDITPVEVLD